MIDAGLKIDPYNGIRRATLLRLLFGREDRDGRRLGRRDTADDNGDQNQDANEELLNHLRLSFRNPYGHKLQEMIINQLVARLPPPIAQRLGRLRLNHS